MSKTVFIIKTKYFKKDEDDDTHYYIDVYSPLTFDSNGKMVSIYDTETLDEDQANEEVKRIIKLFTTESSTVIDAGLV